MKQKPKILYIEIDDEITDIFEKIDACKEKELYLAIPAHSLLITSLVNLKLIAKKAKELHKTVMIITQDKIGRTLASQAGLTAIADFKDTTDHEEKAEQIVQKVKEVKETLEDASPEEVKNMVVTKLKSWGSFIAKKFAFHEDNKISERYKVVFLKPSKKAFIMVLFFSVVLLATISFFALPDATVKIYTKLTNVASVTNIVLTENPTNFTQKAVHITPIEVTYEKTFKQPATGEIFKGTNAKGVAVLYNEGISAQPIVSNSRLQTQDGLVFLTDEFVTIPESKDGKPGEVQVSVTARDLDEGGQSIGARGNIGPTKFFFPALSEAKQKIIYAASLQNFSGGTSEVEYFVQEEDIDIANRNITQELKNLAPEYLEKELKRAIGEKEGDFRIFKIHDDRFVKTEVLEVDIPKHIVKKSMDSFEVHGKMRARAYFYDRTIIVDILREHLLNHQLTFKEKLLSMDNTSLQFINVFPSKNNTTKITAKMNGLVTYGIDEAHDNELIDKIQHNITGVSMDDAERFIQNLSEVDTVRIKLSPFWQKTIPTIKENIHVVIIEPQ